MILKTTTDRPCDLLLQGRSRSLASRSGFDRVLALPGVLAQRDEIPQGTQRPLARQVQVRDLCF